MRIALIAHHVNHQAGPPKVTAALIERLYEDHQVSVFSHTIEGIDLSKIKHHRVPAVTRSKFLAYISFLVSSTIIFAVLSLFRKRDFDIIHGYVCAFSTDVITFHFCEREGLRLEKTNIIEMPHKSIWQKLKALDHRIYRRLAVFIEGLIFSHNSSEARIVISARMKEQFIHYYGTPEAKFFVIPNGVDCVKYNPGNVVLYREEIRHRHSLTENDLVVLFIGINWARKGVAQAIEALSLLDAFPVKLLIVGPDDPTPYLKLAKHYGVETQVIFAGTTREPRKYYAASDIFLLPSLYEPFGLVILEAMATGLPVVVSREAGAAELIHDGVDGLLLKDPTDAREIAAKLETLLKDSKLRKRLGEKARRTALQQTWEQVAQRTLEVYRRVLV